MKKLTYEDKVKRYLEKKDGKSLSYIAKKYQIGTDHIKYMIRLIDKHGYNILLQERTVSYPIQFKQEVIDRNIVDSFIENIIVNDEKGVDIIFRYKDQYKFEKGI